METTTAPVATRLNQIIKPLALAKRLMYITISLVIIHVVLYVVLMFLWQIQHPKFYFAKNIFSFFDLNGEANIPTFFSTANLVLSSILLFFIASYSKESRYWKLLGLVMLFLAIDEFAQIHEWVDTTLSSEKFKGTVLYYFWVVPYSLAALGLFLYIKNWLRKLPPRTIKLFFLAGGIFIMGAAGLELGESYFDSIVGHGPLYNPYTAVLIVLEELMEMSGIIIFIYSLLEYIARPGNSIKIVGTTNYHNA